MRTTSALLVNRLLSAALLVALLSGGVAVSGLSRLAAEDNARWVEVQMQDGSTVVAQLVRSSRRSVTVLENGAEKEIDMTRVKLVNYLDAPPAQVPLPAPPAVPTPVPAVDPAAAPTTTADPGAAPATPPAAEPAPAPAPAVNPEAGAAAIEVPLPSTEANKTEMFKIELKWTKSGRPAPWYKLNRGSSLHQMPDWTRAEAARETEILDAINALPDPAAKKKLAGMPTEAAPYEVIFLLDSDPRKAQACAELLITRGNRDVAKYLIEALYATTDMDDKALPEWLQPYAKTLVAGCVKLTDTNSAADPAKAPFSAAEFVDAWKANPGDVLQLGEPEYKPDPVPANADAQKAAWVTYFRTLNLKRMKFTEPKEEKVDLTRKYPHVKDGELDRSIQADIKQLTEGKDTDRIAAKDRLLGRTWPDVAPYLTQNLLETHNAALRLTILDMVNTKGDRAFTWAVLMTLRDSWGTPTAVPGPDNAAVIRICDNLCRKLTGFTGQPAVQPTFVGGYKSVQGFLDYWNEHYAEFPVQYSEPDLDKKLAKYNEYLKELRVIKAVGAK